ncbi:uncharacterized protein LOC131650918 [Vicia villosa]|uniref:uncharacterized protein LOC131650918 n=1 Tax=Vicia villosa TaxID=3911 RepID=UPI00273B8AB3|nr:uncharacterized protein LOC131650918 [Vicia villosa]
MNRCLEAYLRCFTSDNPNQWFKYLHLAEYWHNTAYHSATKMSPFEALYGREPPFFPQYLQGTTSIPDLDINLHQRQELLSTLRSNLERARKRMTEQANKKRVDCTFNVGDLVLLRLQPYRQSSIHRRTSQKLSHRYFGPFPVRRRIGPVAYDLELPPTSRIHSVFHVSQLRAYHGDNSSGNFKPLPPDLQTFTDTEPSVEEVIAVQERNGQNDLDTFGLREKDTSENGRFGEKMKQRFVSSKLNGNLKRTSHTTDISHVTHKATLTHMGNSTTVPATAPPVPKIATVPKSPPLISLDSSASQSGPLNFSPSSVHGSRDITTPVSEAATTHPAGSHANGTSNPTPASPKVLSTSNNWASAFQQTNPYFDSNLEDKVVIGPESSDSRPKRIIKRPSYLNDYMLN